jgi:hypothetical protein
MNNTHQAGSEGRARLEVRPTKGRRPMYQARQCQTFGPLVDNPWTECDEVVVRQYLGTARGVGVFHIHEHDMKAHGKIVNYCRLIEFRWIDDDQRPNG